MSAYIIEGGHPLDGSVRIHGAKNSVLPILAACLLAPGECVIPVSYTHLRAHET